MTKEMKRISYALSFASFLLRNLKETSGIRSIILYGSVVRKTSNRESDIDIFIDVTKPTEVFQKRVNTVVSQFYSSKEAIIFKLMGIENEISVISGKLDNHKDLKRSIMSDGYVLWSKYIAVKPNDSKHNVIVFWEGIERNRGAFLNKIYGFTSGKVFYKGFLEESGGTKLGKSCIMIPIEHFEELRKMIKKYGVRARTIEVFT